MSSHEELTKDLEALDHGSVIRMLSAVGEPINVALRIDDLDGLIGWALAGVGDPWPSEKLARGIAAANGYFEVLVEVRYE